jgi:uncharacterized protein (TIGR03118 family)
MNADRSRKNSMFGWMALALALATAIALAAAPTARADPEGRYQQHNLVTDGFIRADNTDSVLKNPWGIAFNPTGPVWISDNGSGFSTVYIGSGAPFLVGNPPTVPLVVTIPKAAKADQGNPTGIVFNGSSGFNVGGSPAVFIFATEDGVLAAWNPLNLTNAILIHDNSAAGTVYKGLALSAGGNGSLLYAADFHNNKIDVWDNMFTPVTTLGAGAFTDPSIPKGFAPFGIQAINGNVYVTYAKQDADAHDDVQGKGLGYVDVFDPNGNLIDRVASKGPLNAPWGLALAPAGFGEFSNSLLVGNFGDGRINAFDLASGEFLGGLKGADGHPITIDGLWGLAFGNGFAGQPVNTLYFTAGSNGEADGLYGRIDPIPGNPHGHGHD